MKKLMFVFSIFLLVITFTACGEKKTEVNDIITQKETEEGRTQITVLVKYAFSIDTFEKAVEEKFPDIDIVQVGNYTKDMGIEEYAARMEHDDLTDVVMTWPLNVGEEYWADRLLDLSGMDFTSSYNLSMLNDISRDGKLYYLPGPAQIRGILYNKTMFEENGWEVPKSYEEFVDLCKIIEESGMRSIQLGFKNSEVLDTAFVGYNYSDAYSKPQDTQWINDYNGGKGSFGEHFGSSLDLFQEMIDAGIWKPEDLNVGYAERETMFFNRQCAMVEDSVLMARMGYSLTGSTDEIALMPFFNKGEESDWARLYMVCYIGLNKHLAEAENKDKYDLVMKLMDYVSTPEGQETLAGDTGAMYSSLRDVPPPDIPEIKELVPTLTHGRYAIFPTLKNAQSALREGLAGMVEGTKTKADVIKMVDEQNRNPSVISKPKILGNATADFTMLETGNFITDVMREWSECEVALFLDNGKDGLYNGKGVSGSLYAGDVTNIDIKRITPDLKHGEKGILQKVSMTGADLLRTLEYAIPVNNNVTGWFYYFSGIKMEYNPLAEPGSRIKKVTMKDGNNINVDKIYTIAIMDETVPEEYIQSCESTEDTIVDILEQAVMEKKTISPSGDDRFKIVTN